MTTTTTAENVPTRRDLETLAEVCRALSEPNRLAILELLSRRPGLSINELVQELAGAPYGAVLAQPTISHHIHILARARFVKTTKAGTNVHVIVDRARLRELGAMVNVIGKS